jgi:hypothetical protein
MAEKTRQSLNTASDRAFDPVDDLHTDYVLIAVGVGAALIALVYLLLT